MVACSKTVAWLEETFFWVLRGGHKYYMQGSRVGKVDPALLGQLSCFVLISSWLLPGQNHGGWPRGEGREDEW